MIAKPIYNFSFTASSLRLKEMILVAKHLLENTEIDYINDLGEGKSATGKRMLVEFNKRLETLTKEQLKLLVDGDLTTQKQIAFLSICKTYAFIRDFVLEVLREKYLIFDYEITEGEYLSFYRRKNDLHTEMDALTELSESKIKQVTFKILEQAAIIDNIKNKTIQPQLLDDRIISAIKNDHQEWLKIYFYSDMDIAQTID